MCEGADTDKSVIGCVDLLDQILNLYLLCIKLDLLNNYIVLHHHQTTKHSAFIKSTLGGVQKNKFFEFELADSIFLLE